MSPKPSNWSKQTRDVFDSIEQRLADAVGVVRVEEPSDDSQDDGESSMEGLLARVARQRAELARYREAERRPLLMLTLKPDLDVEAAAAEFERALRVSPPSHIGILSAEQAAEPPSSFPPSWDVQELGADGAGELTSDGLYHLIATAPGGDITIRVRQAIDDPSAYWLVVETMSRVTLDEARTDAIALAWSLPLQLLVEAL